YYGDRGDEVLTEDSAPGTDFLARACVAWEAEAAPATEAGVRTVFARTGIVLAAHGGALKQMLLPFKLGLGGRQGSGEQWMSWIALADEVGAIRFAIENDALRGPANLVAPNPVANAEFAKTLGRVLNRPTILPTPLLPLKLRYGAELVDTLLMGSQRVAPTRLRAVGYRFGFDTLEAALRAVVRA
ncbi:MAG TPA: TIGR01777 family oxidoreductase, partial [Acidimicrobiia bacterium]|nr:TIGR01777 family oxidoreductase [Acidimicrobiia bacterium]